MTFIIYITFINFIWFALNDSVDFNIFVIHIKFWKKINIFFPRYFIDHSFIIIKPVCLFAICLRWMFKMGKLESVIKWKFIEWEFIIMVGVGFKFLLASQRK